MDEIDKALEALDFEPTVQCQLQATKWAIYGAPYIEGLNPPGTTAVCPNPSVGMYLTRLCPCWHNPWEHINAGADLNEMQFSMGILVRRMPLCAPHVAYFEDYLHYPFLCPGCGFHYEDATEVLRIERDI